MTKPLALAAVLAAAALAFRAVPARADGMVNPEPEAPAEAAPAGGGGSEAAAPSLSAKLVESKAGADSARVQVKVSGVDSPRLQYKVDDSPAFETSDTNVGFRGLKSGQHRISVLLEGQDGAPLGPSQSLDVNVP